MAMVEARGWQHGEDSPQQVEERARLAEERACLAEEQRLDAEGRCFAAERRRLDAERRLEQVERLLEEARLAGARMQMLLAELAELAAHLRRALQWKAAPASSATPADADAAEQRAQMTDALAAAVERLRARVAEVKAIEREPAPTVPQAPVAPRPPHKHSTSAIARWRNKRKLRRTV